MTDFMPFSINLFRKIFFSKGFLFLGKIHHSIINPSFYHYIYIILLYIFLFFSKKVLTNIKGYDTIKSR